MIATLLCAALACGSKEAPPPAKEAPPAKADADDELARRKAEREQKQAEEARAAAERGAKLDALAVLPDKPEKKLDKACGAMLAAYDAHMRAVLEGDQKTKWETGGNEMQLAVFKKECERRPADVANCQTHGLAALAPEDHELLADLMKTCAERFGGGEG
ncbi:MAG: hypothetical protein KC636_28225 [Myxococcales bacterium]|nr:hypothetical protein [Myxococcales bacterium]